MQLSDGVLVFLAQYLVFFSLLVIPYLWVRRERHDIVRIMVSVVVAYTISEIIKTLVSAPRPFVVGEFEPLIAMQPREFYGSFPSGHTAFLTALAASVFFTEKIPGAVIFLMAAVVGAGRVLVGVHYPLDILVGGAIGITTAWVFKILHKRFPVW